MGALWSPVAFLWIALGGIFAGAVHDYLSGMISLRHNGSNVPNIIDNYLGPIVKHIFNIFTVIFLILVGAVFVIGPAKLLAKLTSEYLDFKFWLGVIFLYYFLATILPITKIIGRIYPIFGALLIIMGVGMVSGLLTKGYQIPELTLDNLHPQGAPVWPLLFITIACGAISGFSCYPVTLNSSLFAK
jgi:carbon starvation protein CstA